MNLKLTTLALTATAVLAACQPVEDHDPARDYYTQANIDAFVTEHLALDLDVDFEAKALRGTATLHLQSLHPDARQVRLDTRDLVIEAVRLGLPGDEKQPADHRLLDAHPLLGQALEIDLPDRFDPQGGFEVEVRYQTTPGASALQWLEPGLTAGGEHPMLFSQSQSIHARSWIPLQDSPSVRLTYEAVVRTPPELLAVMSADNDPQAVRDGEYRFSMPQPIPSYLMAIAVGHFFFEPIGEDTGVYAEPELLAASAWEFAETQQMLDLAEEKFGPYEWGRYDLLILPPSFPYGGMENPRLSFITPSVLAGDRSLVSLIAHELAHSWSGNLVTNATWRDIWLNEGTTSYLEARLMEDLFSVDRANEERVLGFASLKAAIERVPEAFQPLAPTVLPEHGEDPQQGMEYAKGQFFLEHLERAFGREVFDAFMTGYFQAHEWQSITTEQFLQYLDAQLLSPNPGVLSREDVEAWLYGPALPPGVTPPKSPTLEAAAQGARDWAAGEVAATELAESGWSPQATVYFINSIPAGLDTARLAELDAAFGFSASKNAEITQAWFTQVAIRRFEPAYGAMQEHLLRHGRMKLIVPVYAALANNGSDRALAEETFAQARDGYHPMTVAAVEQTLAGGR